MLLLLWHNARKFPIFIWIFILLFGVMRTNMNKINQCDKKENTKREHKSCCCLWRRLNLYPASINIYSGKMKAHKSFLLVE